VRIETVVIELTNNCNLRCKHCYGHFEKNTIIGISDFENVINQLYDLGCTRITLSGGEPLLLGEQLVDYVKIVKNKGFPFIALTTNGTISVSDNELYKYFNLIQVSIDGVEATHDAIRGKGNFNKSISFIKELSKYREKISIMMSVHKSNY
jgi:MoaA/NifB/PqqE/SkfB family radical SAM enzyme